MTTKSLQIGWNKVKYTNDMLEALESSERASERECYGIARIWYSALYTARLRSS